MELSFSQSIVTCLRYAVTSPVEVHAPAGRAVSSPQPTLSGLVVECSWQAAVSFLMAMVVLSSGRQELVYSLCHRTLGCAQLSPAQCFGHPEVPRMLLLSQPSTRHFSHWLTNFISPQVPGFQP